MRRQRVQEYSPYDNLPPRPEESSSLPRNYKTANVIEIRPRTGQHGSSHNQDFRTRWGNDTREQYAGYRLQQIRPRAANRSGFESSTYQEVRQIKPPYTLDSRLPPARYIPTKDNWQQRPIAFTPMMDAQYHAYKDDVQRVADSIEARPQAVRQKLPPVPLFGYYEEVRNAANRAAISRDAFQHRYPTAMEDHESYLGHERAFKSAYESANNQREAQEELANGKFKPRVFPIEPRTQPRIRPKK